MKLWTKKGNDFKLGTPPVLSNVDATLLNGLYRDHYLGLCKAINHTFGSGPPEPEDLVQAAFEKFARLKNPLEIKDPRSFIFISARNLALDFKRRSKTNDAYIAEQIALDTEFKLEGITPERVLLAKDQFSLIADAIKTLPKKQQVILSMSKLEGKSFKQIREETGWSAGDISRNLQMGMDVLVSAMQKQRR
ncbi:MAG: hypothetical protein COA43_05545 [Robiginitomaculum sp.]|nr:MAG: hypothetical protein COA43_05545 [Robiginitomaculum sp.]